VNPEYTKEKINFDRFKYLDHCIKQFYKIVIEYIKSNVEKMNKDDPISIRFNSCITTLDENTLMLFKIFKNSSNIEFKFSSQGTQILSPETLIPFTFIQNKLREKYILDIKWTARNRHVYSVKKYFYKPIDALKSFWDASLDGRLTDITF